MINLFLFIISIFVFIVIAMWVKHFFRVIKTSNNVDKVDKKLIKSTINRFFDNHGMHPSAKAVYETSFYYLSKEL